MARKLFAFEISRQASAAAVSHLSHFCGKICHRPEKLYSNNLGRYDTTNQRDPWLSTEIHIIQIHRLV